MKKIELSPNLLSGSHPEILEVRNLRPYGAASPLWLTPVGEFAAYDHLAGLRPLCRFSGGKYLFVSGETLVACNPDVLPGTGRPSGGEVHCAVDSGADTALVMTAAGALHADASGSMLTVSAARREFPPVVFRTRRTADATVSVPSRKLSAAYTGGSSLSAADRRKLVADFAGAYADACHRAAVAGYFVQPVMAQCRYYDESGLLLHFTPPVLLVAPAGNVFRPWQTLSTSDGITVDSYTVSVPSFTVEADFGSALCSEVARVEILLSGQFHPYVPGAKAEVVSLRDTYGDILRISLPGYAAGISSETAASSKAVLMKAVSRLDSILEPVMQVVRPFSAGAERKAAVSNSYSAPLDESVSALRAKLAAPAVFRQPREVLMSLPHTFSARCVARDAAVTLWGNITVHRFGGYDAACYGAADTVPSVGPLIAYPAPDVSSVTVSTAQGNVAYSRTFPLVPDDSGRWSVYIENDSLCKKKRTDKV